jgi:hypothetical protein
LNGPDCFQTGPHCLNSKVSTATAVVGDPLAEKGVNLHFLTADTPLSTSNGFPANGFTLSTAPPVPIVTSNSIRPLIFICRAREEMVGAGLSMADRFASASVTRTAPAQVWMKNNATNSNARATGRIGQPARD